jgi:outer membrane protein assembly factor BamA
LSALALALAGLLCLAAAGACQNGALPDSLAAEDLEWSDWTVAGIRISGLEHVREQAVRRELQMRAGDLYSDEELVLDANALKNTQLFARLVVTVSPDSLDQAVQVSYALKERPRFLFLPLLNPGDTPGEWDYGFALQHNNVAGMGRRLTLEARDGSSRRLAVTWTDPWLWNRRLRWHLVGEYGEQTVRRSEGGQQSEYQRRLLHGGTRFEAFLDPQRSWFLEPGWYSLESGDHLGDRTTINPLGRDRFLALALGARINTTDIHVNPERGLSGFVSAWMFGLHGTDNPAGTRMDLSLARFHPLGRTVLGLNGQLAATVGRRPSYMEHTLGGHTLVRGLDSGSFAGWSSAIGKLEWRFPLLDKRIVMQRYDVAVGGVLFVDCGQTWAELFEHGTGLRGGAGGGLRVFAPFVDVISLDGGYSREHGLQVYISSGQSF